MLNKPAVLCLPFSDLTPLIHIMLRVRTRPIGLDTVESSVDFKVV